MLQNRRLQFTTEPGDGTAPTPVRLLPRHVWIGVTPSTDVTSLTLMDANGNELEVERIDYGPHPLPRQRCSSIRERNLSDPTTEESERGADPSRQVDDLRIERQCCSSAIDDSCGALETVPDHFYVVYTYSTTATPIDVSETASGGATHVVRSCTPYYVPGSRCCSHCCYRSHGNVTDQRTGCQTG